MLRLGPSCALAGNLRARQGSNPAADPYVEPVSEAGQTALSRSGRPPLDARSGASAPVGSCFGRRLEPWARRECPTGMARIQLAALVMTALVATACSGSPESTTPSTGSWRLLPAGPLSPREPAIAVGVGERVL